MLIGPFAFAQSGSLDLSFDTDGIYTNDISSNGTDIAYGIAEQADGKIVVVGYTATTILNVDALVMRMNSDGTPDLSFDADGKVVLDLSIGGADRFTDVLIQPDGKIVCVGYVYDGNDYDVILVRFLPDGSYDNSFGIGGKARPDFGQGEDDQAYAIALQPDGSIVVAGRIDSQNSSNLLLARFTSSGALDPTFDVFGSVTFDPSTGGEDGLYDVEVAADGKIVATGYSEHGPSNQNMIIVRVDAAGQPDLSFSSDGFFNADLLTGANEYGFSLKIMDDNAILVAGSAALNGNTNASLIKVKSNGVLDGSFNSDGKAYYDFTIGGLEVFRKLEIQSDGQIVAAGYMDNLGTGRDFLAARISPNGDLDSGFGVSGWASADIENNSTDNMRSMALLSDGKIMIGGYSAGKLSLVRFENEVAVGIQAANLSGTKIKAWPQPFSQELKIELPAGVNEAASVEVFNISGQLQFVQTLSQSQPGQVIDLSQQVSTLAAGVYVLKVSSSESVHTAKLIKQ